MQDLSIHKTRELPARAKEMLEKLLGHQLAAEEEVSIWASRPHAASTGEARKAAWHYLNRHLDKTRVQGQRRR